MFIASAPEVVLLAKCFFFLADKPAHSLSHNNLLQFGIPFICREKLLLERYILND